MSAGGASGGLDEGLRTRFRAAGDQIAWRDAPAPTGTPRSKRAGRGVRVRIAHLNDEEARVEETETGGARGLVVDSGPVGALVLVLRWDAEGAPTRLITHEAGRRDGFPSGAIEAEWRSAGGAAERAVPLKDLVALARYALA